MNTNDDRTASSATVRRPVLLGLFAGSAVGLGYLLAGVPNVELMTVTCALAGAILGPVLGAVCGGIAAAAYSLGSPLGAPVPLLLAGQMLGMALAGVFGGVGARPLLALLRRGRRSTAIGLAASLGLVAAVSYDVLTNAAIIVAFRIPPAAAIGPAIPLALVHLGINLVAFALILPTVLPRLAHLAGPGLVGSFRRVGLIVLLVFCCGTSWAAGPPDDPQRRPHGRPPTAPTDSTATITPPDGKPAGASGLAPGDTTAALPDARGAMGSGGAATGRADWKRPLWQPFRPHVLDALALDTPLLVMTDGGLGAAALVLHDVGTSPNPTFLSDGLPVGVGHALTDDPWLVLWQGSDLAAARSGDDGWGGTDGVVDLALSDPTPDRAYSVYHGTKGPHETYQRSVSLLTPEADWRLAFDFEENLDNEGYDFIDSADDRFNDLDEYSGHAKLRNSRGRLVRRLDDTSSLSISYGTQRKTKDELPAWDAEHQELWGKDLSVTARGREQAWLWRSSFFFTARDVQWGDRSAEDLGEDLRRIEASRQGVLLELTRPDQIVAVAVDSQETPPPRAAPYTATSLRLAATSWRVQDSGAAESWAGAELAGPVQGKGQTAVLTGERRLDLGTLGVACGLGADWADHGDLAPSAHMALEQPVADPWWRISADVGGRAPRSDELLTPVLRNVAGDSLVIAPNPGLEREKSLRLGVLLRRRVFGTEFAVDASWRRLRDGITWQPDPDETDLGRWANDLDLTALCVTGRLERAGRFLGWGRMLLEGTWRDIDETTGQAALLPPTRTARAVVMWENHFFREDGILQLAYHLTYRNEMNDPWDPSRSVILPSTTCHDLMIGFRLVGAHLSVALRNLTDEPLRLSSATLSPGREMRWRLNWAFYF